MINWAQPETYEWDSEDTLLASELGEMMTAREVHLAEIKKRQDEYQASRGNAAAGGASKATAAAGGASKATTAPAKGDYNF